MAIPSGYPVNYRLGFDMILWFINFFVIIIIAIFFLIKAIKEAFINKKQIFLSDFFICAGIGFTHFLFQMGYCFPELYNIFIPSGYLAMILGLTGFIYLWERNLINLKKIPTIFAIIISLIMLFNLFYSILYQHQLVEIMSILLPILGIIALSFFIILIWKFSNVLIGITKIYGFLTIFAIIFFTFGYILDTYFAYQLFPDLSPLMSPIIVLICSFLFIYGLNGISDKIISYYKRANICTVHRGKISKDEHIYYCPSCSTTYCQRCYKKVIQEEGCWNCQDLSEMEKSKDQKDIILINK